MTMQPDLSIKLLVTLRSQRSGHRSKWWLKVELSGFMLTLVTHALSTSRFYVPIALILPDCNHTTSPLKSSDDSTLLTSKTDTQNCWTEHYGLLFGDKWFVSEGSVVNIPKKKAIGEELDDSPFEKLETAILIYKRSDKSNCSNYRGITLQSVA